MLIEDADRFGLSQLHQLRGRVGRGQAPGLCILFADPLTDEGRARMDAIARTNDAFALVEADPELDDPAHRRLRQEVLARLGDGRAEWLARG
jgi:ATP-dependent DNA helicase RecG